RLPTIRLDLARRISVPTRIPAQKHVPVSEVRNHLGALVNRVYRGEEHVVIEKSGIPVAALIGMREYEEFRRMMAERVHNRLVRGLGREAERVGLTEEQLFEELKETRQDVFREKYGDIAER